MRWRLEIGEQKYSKFNLAVEVSSSSRATKETVTASAPSPAYHPHSRGLLLRTSAMNLLRVSPIMVPGSKRLLQTASFSAAAATQIFPHQRSERAEALRVAAPPRAVWKVPAAAAVDARPEAPSATQPSNADVSHFLLPQPAASKSAAAVQQQLQQPQQVGPAPPGDLRLVEFMEQVKQELWEFSAMPLRKRFRVQSLLR